MSLSESLIADGAGRDTAVKEFETAPLAGLQAAPTVPVALLKAMRPKQWVKNILLFMGILFSIDESHPLGHWFRSGAAFVVFCALASAIYLINDACDVEQDRLHPKKRHRPIAAGHISVPTAVAAAVALAVGGLAGAFMLGLPFALVAVTYVVLTVAYSFKLKHVVLIDVLALAACYVLRAVAGVVVISAWISPWLVMCTTLGALLIGLAKRRAELVSLTDATKSRKILEEYTVGMLDQLIGIVTAATLMAYMLYTFSSPEAKGHSLMILSIPFVIYGIFRYFYLMHREGKGGDPTSDLIEDKNILVCGFLWAVFCGAAKLLS